MNEWHDFFLAQAGAAGVLTGLVFVGVSINLEKIVSDPSSGLAGRGSPHPAGRRAHGLRLGARAGSGPGRARRGGARGEASRLGVDRGHLAAAVRDWGTMRADLRGPFVLRVVLGQVATLPLVIAGIAVLSGGPGGLYWLMAGTIFSILAALFEAWVLLVEINR